MASLPQLRRQFIEYTTSLYKEGYLDKEFMQLRKMQDQDASDPNFVARVVSVFLKKSEHLLKNLGTNLQQKSVDYKQVAIDLHLFKGSSSIIGAQRLTSRCVLFMNYCMEKNLDGCFKCLHQANHEYILIKNKLEALIMLEQHILQAGGSIPMVEYGLFPKV